MDSRKKWLWEARRQGPVPNFGLLTIESPRWRPPPKGAAWVGELRRRARCLRFYQEWKTALPLTALAKVRREFGISARTLHQWLARYREKGLVGLIPASRWPRRSPRETSRDLEWAILAVRLRTGWGVERIAQELGWLGLGPLTHNAVYGVLERRAMKVPLRRRGRKAGCRYQREVPNDLWHMDVKGPLYFGPGVGPIYGLAILDDCSRFCVAATFTDNRRMDTAISLLEQAVATWGVARQLMSDNGSEFVGIGPKAGPSRFLRRLGELGIQHLPIKLRTPETNGKIERFWLTLEQELLMRVAISALEQGQQALTDYLIEYNFHRLHSALGYRPPAEIYCPEEAGTARPGDLQALMPYLLSLKSSLHNQSGHHADAPLFFEAPLPVQNVSR